MGGKIEELLVLEWIQSHHGWLRWSKQKHMVICFSLMLAEVGLLQHWKNGIPCPGTHQKCTWPKLHVAGKTTTSKISTQNNRCTMNLIWTITYKQCGSLTASSTILIHSLVQSIKDWPQVQWTGRISLQWSIICQDYFNTKNHEILQYTHKI